jgi:hypothetical protein
MKSYGISVRCINLRSGVVRIEPMSGGGLSHLSKDELLSLSREVHVSKTEATIDRVCRETRDRINKAEQALQQYKPGKSGFSCGVNIEETE